MAPPWQRVMGTGRNREYQEVGRLRQFWNAVNISNQGLIENAQNLP
jgi:hypothetical protein